MKTRIAVALAGAASVLLAGAASAQTLSLPPAQQGVAYTADLTVPSGYLSATYSSATLPPGLTLLAQTVAGTPMTAGTYVFTINVSGDVMGICTSPGPPPMSGPCSKPESTVQTYQLQVAPAPAAVPTLSEWAMILLGVMLAGAAALTIQRRRAA